MNKAEPTRYADVASWELADSLWDRIEPFLPKPNHGIGGAGRSANRSGGVRRAERRKVMAGVLYVPRTGGQWNALTKEQ